MTKNYIAAMKKSYEELKASGEWKGGFDDFEKYGYEFFKVSDACSAAHTLEKIRKAQKLIEAYVKKFKKDKVVLARMWAATHGLRVKMAREEGIREREAGAKPTTRKR